MRRAVGGCIAMPRRQAPTGGIAGGRRGNEGGGNGNGEFGKEA